jgi:hypothetical protein
MQIDPPKRKHTKTVDGQTIHYDEVRHEPVITYKPIDPRKPNVGVYPVQDTIEVPVDPDIEGNTKYWKPEKVLGGDCIHSFRLMDVAKREIECDLCSWAVTFHISAIRETKEGMFVRIAKKEYPVSTGN